MEPALAAAAAAERTAGWESPRGANFDMALEATAVRRSQHAPLDSALLQRSGIHTCLQVDTDMKSGTRRSLSPTPIAPSEKHATITANVTEQPVARATDESMHCSTTLQGASAWKSGIGHSTLDGEHVERCPALPPVRPAR